MTPVLDVVTTLCIGLLIGTEFAVAVFINPILLRLGPREELRAIRLFAAKAGRGDARLVRRQFSAADCGISFQTRRNRLPVLLDCGRRNLGRSDRADDSLSGSDQQSTGTR